MKLKFDVSSGEYEIIHTILRDCLTEAYGVWVFGSRAKNQVKYNSDLDLAIEYSSKIDKKILRKIKFELEESKLAFNVDVLDLNGVSEAFKKIIRKEMIEFPMEYKKYVPKLRFGEFDGEWVEKKLGDALKIGSGKDYKHLSKGDIPVFGTGGYMTSVNDFLYDGDSVCIGRKGTIDKPMFLSGKFWTVDTLFFTHSLNNTVPRFIYPLFQKINWKKYNEASGVPSLSKKTIEKIKVFIPSLNEQQKIATFLTAVDQKIEKLTKKEKLLVDYKKGVMQKIFSQEIRFRGDDGEIFGDWVERKLGEVCEFTQGVQIPFSEQVLEQKDGYIRYLYIRDFFTSEFTTYVKDIYPSKIIYEDEIMMVNTGNTAGKAYMGSTGILSNNCFKITFNKDIIHNKFLFLFLTSNFTQRKIQSFFNSGGQPHLGHKNIALVTIFLPSKEEQTKIANFLSSIDKKIEQVNSQIDESKCFKKGLLQQMFI